ncbi:addiction module protein [Mycolicibacterium novocastrense]|nr:addiction module protein [Mycolicibacterium novocastrense]
MWERLQQMLLHRGVNTYLELALWITLVYVVIGVVYAAFHIELIVQLEAALSGDFTIFANLAALVVAVVLWPLLLISSWVCGVAGCGVF